MKHYRIVRDDWGAVERLTGAALIIAAIALTLLALSTCAAEAGTSGPALPRSIILTGPVEHVFCAGPCCCGQVEAVVRGHWYADMSYCRWFRPLREGTIVTTRAGLVR